MGRGVDREIPSYADLPDSLAVGSSHVGNRGVAKSSPSNRDVESERVVGRSSGLSPTAPLGGESVCDGNSLPPTVPSVDRPSFMADSIHSSSGQGGYRGSDSLKRHLDDVIPEKSADLNKAMAKLETMFSEKETRDDKIKELEVVANELASAVETATARAESLQADLFASISREAILRAQEVARAVRAAIAKYWGCLERVKEYLADKSGPRSLFSSRTR
ncbi:hypothetical protein HID58_042858 [Brassica napus]|uniref:Uncharacterized protein n=1 Tax=Brassica napus TaxID=3708 RepID=A0ABQ8BGI6_BRANA|nr:hypothetical protein HID58_042858 [Brassica napus]